MKPEREKHFLAGDWNLLWKLRSAGATGVAPALSKRECQWIVDKLVDDERLVAVTYETQVGDPACIPRNVVFVQQEPPKKNRE